MNRIYFPNQEDCINFFVESKNNLNFTNWKSMAKHLKTSRSMLDKYRSRELCLPSDRFSILLNSLCLDRQNYFLNNIMKRNENWGKSIGGKHAYALNKDKFAAWRAKFAPIKPVKYDFNTNLPLSDKLCEFIGVIIGDGFTNKYSGHSYQTQIVGDGLLDANYYYDILKPMCIDLFGITPKITKKARDIRLNIYSKRLFEMLTNRFKIPAGVKCYTVTIPDEILNSEELFLNSALRGMFNTDGGVGLDKRPAYKQPYLRINYTSASKNLIAQMSSILKNYAIPHSIHKRDNTLMIQINGIQNVNKFMSKIGFSNERHLSKIRNNYPK